MFISSRGNFGTVPKLPHYMPIIICFLFSDFYWTIMPRNPKRALGTRPYKNYTQKIFEKALSEARHCRSEMQPLNMELQKNTLHLKSQEKHTMSVGRATVFSAGEEGQFVAHIVAVSNSGSLLILLICAAS